MHRKVQFMSRNAQFMKILIFNSYRKATHFNTTRKKLQVLLLFLSKKGIIIYICKIIPERLKL